MAAAGCTGWSWGSFKPERTPERNAHLHRAIADAIREIVRQQEGAARAFSGGQEGRVPLQQRMPPPQVQSPLGHLPGDWPRAKAAPAGLGLRGVGDRQPTGLLDSSLAALSPEAMPLGSRRRKGAWIRAMAVAAGLSGGRPQLIRRGALFLRLQQATALT